MGGNYKILLKTGHFATMFYTGFHHSITGSHGIFREAYIFGIILATNPAAKLRSRTPERQCSAMAGKP